MKSKVLKGITVIALAGTISACGMTRTQQNTATGIAIGGVAGHVLGGDMTSTVAGAALGGVIGSQISTRDDRDDYYYKSNTGKGKGKFKKHRDWDDDDDD